jgi:hypothetical protein
MASTDIAIAGLGGQAPDDVRPYPPGWLDRLIARIAALPVPRWIAYTVLLVASVVLSCSQAWASGSLPFGEVRADLVYWGVFLVALIWVVDHLDRVAGQSFDAFRPALEISDGDAAELRYRLLVMPARLTWGITIFGVVLTPLYYVIDPVGSLIVGLTPLGLALRAISESFSSVVLLLILVQLLRQMRTVTSIIASAPRVDLFKPGPLYAFSKLTSRTAIAVVVLIGTSTYVASWASPQTSEASILLLWAPWTVGIPALALAAFILPLRGMHDRLVAEKARLQGDVEARLQRLLGDVNRDVDAGDLGRADAFNKTLATMLQQREVVAKLPTWPWSPGTFRALLTAVALPLALFLVQRLLSQVL